MGLEYNNYSSTGTSNGFERPLKPSAERASVSLTIKGIASHSMPAPLSIGRTSALSLSDSIPASSHKPTSNFDQRRASTISVQSFPPRSPRAEHVRPSKPVYNPSTPPTPSTSSEDGAVPRSARSNVVFMKSPAESMRPASPKASSHKTRDDTHSRKRESHGKTDRNEKSRRYEEDDREDSHRRSRRASDTRSRKDEHEHRKSGSERSSKRKDHHSTRTSEDDSLQYQRASQSSKHGRSRRYSSASQSDEEAGSQKNSKEKRARRMSSDDDRPKIRSSKRMSEDGDYERSSAYKSRRRNREDALDYGEYDDTRRSRDDRHDRYRSPDRDGLKGDRRHRDDRYHDRYDGCRDGYRDGRYDRDTRNHRNPYHSGDYNRHYGTGRNAYDQESDREASYRPHNDYDRVVRRDGSRDRHEGRDSSRYLSRRESPERNGESSRPRSSSFREYKLSYEGTPAPPPGLSELPPPPPLSPRKRKTSRDLESGTLDEDEDGRKAKRPKLARQQASIAPPASPPPPSPPTLNALAGPEVLPVADGAVAPNPKEHEVPTPPFATTPAASARARDDEGRQERQRKRSIFPDRSRIGNLGQGKTLDLDRERRVYSKTFVGLGRLQGYMVSKTGDGALGRGTFGTVTKATRLFDGTLVALKMLQNPQQPQQRPNSPKKDGMLSTTAREIKNLKLLKHENIVPLLEMIIDRASDDPDPKTFLVFPYMEHDLCGYIHSTESTLTIQNLKIFAAQMLDGLAEMHRNKIVHRDLKTANILINNKGLLQIADFGLSRSLVEDKPLFSPDDAHYTNMVVTRWYRAPELLMGETMYGPEVDMWSIGCILGEMFTRKVFIMGKSNSHQLMRIFHLVGLPRPKEWTRFDQVLQYNDVQEDDPNLPNKSVPVQQITNVAANSFNSQYNSDVSTWNGFASQRDLVSLIRSLLSLSPSKRPSAIDARANPFFHTSQTLSRELIAPLKQDCRESGSGARNAMSRQIRDDLSEDPFHLKPGAVPPAYNVIAAQNYQAMANNVQATAVANAAMYSAGAMMGGMINSAMMASQPQQPMMNNNNNGMIMAPSRPLPGSNRFDSSSNHSTPRPPHSFNPPRGPGQQGLPYSNGNVSNQYGNMGQPAYNQPPPRPAFTAPTRPLPGATGLPGRPMHAAPVARLPGTRRP